MRIKAYQLLLIIFSPIIYLFFIYRLITGKEELNRFSERFGFTKLKKSELPVIWFHAASVGEFLSIEHLVKLMILKYPKYQVLLTTTTKSSANLVKTKQINNLIHQIVPFDGYFEVKRFIKFWRPVLSVFTESELWPNLISSAAIYGKIALINARITDRSYKKWQKFDFLFKEVINFFDYIDAQSYKDQQRFKNLGAINVINSGNLKFNTQLLPVNIDQAKELKNQIQDRPVFLVISTHYNEEEILIRVHKKLQVKFPNLLTIIAPRHPQRCDEIVTHLRKNNIVAVRKSKSTNISKETEIYIVDEIGILGNYFDLTNIIFVGGSLVPIGGHNILEPAKLGKVIIVGKFMNNFVEITQEFLAKNALIQVENEENLVKIVSEILDNKDLQRFYINNSKALIAKYSNISGLIMQNLESLLDK